MTPGAGRVVRSLTLLLALGGPAVLAGCAANKPSASSSSSSSTTTGSNSHVSTTLASPATSTTVPGCTGTNYTLRLLGTEGAAGTFELTFGFENTSTATCPLYGYPGVSLVGASGADIATSTVRGGTESFTDFTPANVSVGPGETAYFNLAYSDVPTGNGACPTTTAMKVIPPNTSTSLEVLGQFMVCNDTVTVSPVFGKDSPETETTAPAAG